MNEILELIGGIFIVGASYLFANKYKKENERLQNRVNKLENENHDFWTANLNNNKTIKKLDYTIELKDEIIKHCEAMEIKQVKEFIEMQKEIDELNGDKKELHETILFDNDLLIQKTEMLEQEEKQCNRLEKKIESNMVRDANRWSKDQVKIENLEYCLNAAGEENEFLKEVNSSRYSELIYVRRELKSVRASRLKRVIGAEKLM